MIEINTRNVMELWDLYECYKEDFYKTHYSDVKCYDFEDFVDNEVVRCSNCGEYVLKDNLDHSELALNDKICEYCITFGYGE